MKAAMGDRLIVEGSSDHESRKVGVITEVRHPDGSPPYLVRWSGDDHDCLVFPGPDAHVVSGRRSDG
ncbi:DUF1918 domain-containing protein [Herbidospora daliensis]|uniref:DUF1918 domain-containing protein n=1 Tax=Herbidospora daliensis TaxID=295585 RepID=UPI000782B6C8|nr:DUF1918 domain-containing protein [Herbidospora daliensis]